MWTKKNYMKLVEEDEKVGFFFWEWEKLSLILLVKKCGVCLDFDGT
jgi:hypothetical protein